jgi:hypothetical protein
VRPEALFPRTLEAARDEPVVGIYGAIAALGEACHVARPLDAEPPVLERGLAIHLSCSAAASVAVIFAGSSAAMKARATASSICTPPMLRQ